MRLGLIVRLGCAGIGAPWVLGSPGRAWVLGAPAWALPGCARIGCAWVLGCCLPGRVLGALDRARVARWGVARVRARRALPAVARVAPGVAAWGAPGVAGAGAAGAGRGRCRGRAGRWRRVAGGNIPIPDREKWSLLSVF